MNGPAEVTQLHSTTVVLIIESKEFVFAPHDFQTATMILTSHALTSDTASGSLRIESYSSRHEISNAEIIRKEIKARNAAMTGRY